jgi:hypothetical protein
VSDSEHFAAFRDEILTRAHASSVRNGFADAPSGHDDKRAKQVIAACAVVIRDRGAEWCRDNPSLFRSDVLKQLGMAVRIALFVAGMFGGGIWLTLLRWILPVVIEWLTNTYAAVGATGDVAAVNFDAIGYEAWRFLEDSR